MYAPFLIVRQLMLVLLAMPLAATAAWFGLGNSDNIATEVAVLDENTQAGALDFSPDGKHLAVDSWGNGGTDIWDLEKKRIVSHLPEGGTGSWRTDVIRYSPNGRLLAICHGEGTSKINIDVYDTSTWATLHSIGDAADTEWIGGGCMGITFTPDGKELVRLANRDPWRPGNNVMFYDTSSWQVTRGIRTMPLKSYSSSIDSSSAPFLPTPDMLSTDPSNKAVSFNPSTMSISKDGKYLALGGMSVVAYQKNPTTTFHFTVVIIDISSHTLSRAIPVYAESLDWHPDDVRIVVGLGGKDDTVKIFDSSTGETVTSESAGPAHTLVRYTPDGKYLIEKVRQNVEIWDGQHHTLLQIIHADPLCLAVSPDSHYFAIGGHAPGIADINVYLSLTFPGKGRVLIYELK